MSEASATYGSRTAEARLDIQGGLSESRNAGSDKRYYKYVL